MVNFCHGLCVKIITAHKMKKKKKKKNCWYGSIMTLETYCLGFCGFNLLQSLVYRNKVFVTSVFIFNSHSETEKSKENQNVIVQVHRVQARSKLPDDGATRRNCKTQGTEFNTSG